MFALTELEWSENRNDSKFDSNKRQYEHYEGKPVIVVVCNSDQSIRWFLGIEARTRNQFDRRPRRDSRECFPLVERPLGHSRPKKWILTSACPLSGELSGISSRARQRVRIRVESFTRGRARLPKLQLVHLVGRGANRAAPTDSERERVLYRDRDHRERRNRDCQVQREIHRGCRRLRLQNRDRDPAGQSGGTAAGGLYVVLAMLHVRCKLHRTARARRQTG